jgi:glycosyltransferase involved in cell wall biosynthesis
MTSLPPHSKTKKRRILISGGLVAGGPKTHLPLLCSVLRQAGAEVTIASASSDWSHDALEELRATGVRIIVSPFAFGPLQLLGKIWAFLTWPFLLPRDHDLLCCIGHGRMHFWAGRFVRPGGFKIYHEIADCPPPGSLAARIAAQMDAVLATSDSIARSMTGLLPGIPVRPIPFLTSAMTLPPPVQRPPRGDDILRLVFLGRIVGHKRPTDLVDAFPAWNSRAPLAPLRLDLYGGADDDEGEGRRLRQRIDALGLADAVRWHGPYSIRDLDHIFSQTDLVVLPSRYEGLPLVLVEAMQRGIPVVASSAGGIAELGLDNPDVVITPGTDWAPFADGLAAMAARIRAGAIDSVRLHAWTEARYGFEPAAAAWREALLSPETFFAPASPAEVCA